jgi:hypothetical protein
MILNGFELSIEVDFAVVTASRGFFHYTFYWRLRRLKEKATKRIKEKATKRILQSSPASS